MNQLYDEISNGLFFLAPRYASVYAVQVAAFIKKSQQGIEHEPSNHSNQSHDKLMFHSMHQANEDYKYTKSLFNHVQILIPAANGGYHTERGLGGLNNAPEGSTAIISIKGAITKYDQPCGPDGMKTIARMSHEVLSSKNIAQLIYKFETPGGSVYASSFMHDEIHRMKAMYEKPIKAYVDDLCASGGIYIAVACDEIFANSNHASIGSIGTMVTLWDQRKYLEKEGINLLEVYATQSTDKNKIYKDALDGNDADLKKELDVHNEAFLSAVSNGRPAAIPFTSQWSTGKVFFASDALNLGLIDGIREQIEDII